MNHGVENDAG